MQSLREKANTARAPPIAPGQPHHLAMATQTTTRRRVGAPSTRAPTPVPRAAAADLKRRREAAVAALEHSSASEGLLPVLAAAVVEAIEGKRRNDENAAPGAQTRRPSLRARPVSTARDDYSDDGRLDGRPRRRAAAAAPEKMASARSRPPAREPTRSLSPEPSAEMVRTAPALRRRVRGTRASQVAPDGQETARRAFSGEAPRDGDAPRRRRRLGDVHQGARRARPVAPRVRADAAVLYRHDRLSCRAGESPAFARRAAGPKPPRLRPRGLRSRRGESLRGLVAAAPPPPRGEGRGAAAASDDADRPHAGRRRVPRPRLRSARDPRPTSTIG